MDGGGSARRLPARRNARLLAASRAPSGCPSVLSVNVNEKEKKGPGDPGYKLGPSPVRPIYLRG